MNLLGDDADVDVDADDDPLLDKIPLPPPPPTPPAAPPVPLLEDRLVLSRSRPFLEACDEEECFEAKAADEVGGLESCLFRFFPNFFLFPELLLTPAAVGFVC